MKHIALVCTLYVALVLQAGFADRCMMAGVPVPPLLLAAAIATLVAEGGAALVYAALAGLGMDCLGEDPLGIVMLSATLVAWGLHQVVGRSAATRSWLRASIIWTSVAAFGFVLTMFVLSVAIRSVLLGQPIRSLELVNHGAATAGCSAALIFSCRLAARIARRLLPLPAARPAAQWSAVDRWRASSG